MAKTGDKLVVGFRFHGMHVTPMLLDSCLNPSLILILVKISDLCTAAHSKFNRSVHRI